MRKAAQLDSGKAVAILQDGTFHGATLSSTIRGYVRGLANDASKLEWPTVIGDVKGVLGRPESLLKDSDAMVEQAIAIEWAKEDMEGSLSWYVEESGRDLASPKDTVQIASVLSNLPVEEKFRAIDWIGEQRELADWNDHLAVNYGRALAVKSLSLDAEVDRLVGFIDSAELRYELVAKFVNPVRIGGEFRLRYDRDDLVRLVDAAQLPEERAADLQKTIASSVSKGVK